MQEVTGGQRVVGSDAVTVDLPLMCLNVHLPPYRSVSSQSSSARSADPPVIGNSAIGDDTAELESAE